MSAASPAQGAPPAVFTVGSTLRHVVVMTVTGSVGLMAIFVVDLISLGWVSRLGDEALKAAVGYAAQVMFLAMGVNIGLTIAISATVSRALGQGERSRARSLAVSGLTIMAAIATLISIGLFVFRDEVLGLALHADGRAAEVASRYLAIVLPANLFMALGMGYSGVLRAVGDARRAMFVTLAGGVVTAFTDPLFIFGLGLGVYGAAWATVISRFVFFFVGLHGAVVVHDLVGKFDLAATRRDFRTVMLVGLPASLANLATPVGAIYVVRTFSELGVFAVAANTVIDRIIPVLFGVIFALTGSIGPILGQNLGAGLFERVRRAVSDAFMVAVAYAIAAWALLAISAPLVNRFFDVHGQGAEFIIFYCHYGAAAWVFITCLFVANTVFNNLGFPFFALAFNWGRATLGTIPFVALGARWGGVQGAVLGLIAGAALFGLTGVGVAFWVTARVARAPKTI